MDAAPGQTLTFLLVDAPAGMVGTLTFRLTAVSGGESVPASAEDITYVDGVYVATRPAPGPGVYQPIWSGGTGVVFDPERVRVSSSPIIAISGGVVPTAADIRAVSRAEFAEYGYAQPADPLDPDPLNPLIMEALAEFIGVTEIIPDTLVPNTSLGVLTNKALRLWVEHLAAANQPELIDVSADYEVLSSSGTDTASETRRGVGANRRALHPWPPLDRLLALIVRLWNEEQEADLGPDVPTVKQLGALPKPGAWIMDQPVIGHPLDASIFGAPPTLGVASYLVGG